MTIIKIVLKLVGISLQGYYKPNDDRYARMRWANNVIPWNMNLLRNAEYNTHISEFKNPN